MGRGMLLLSLLPFLLLLSMFLPFLLLLLSMLVRMLVRRLVRDSVLIAQNAQKCRSSLRTSEVLPGPGPSRAPGFVSIVLVFPAH